MHILTTFVTSFRIAFRALSRNKMRSLLTMLGIIIGVGAVIAMVSLGQGAEKMVQEGISSLGRNLLFVTSGTSTRGGFRGGGGSLKTLKPEDAEAIKKECSAVKYVSPGNRLNTQVVRGNKNWATTVSGAGEDFLKIREWPLDSGEYFNRSHIRASSKVCVLGQTVAKELFGDQDPIGSIVRIKKIPFRVIGLLSVKGGSSMGGDQDDSVVIPYSTAMKKLIGDTVYINNIMVTAVDADRTKLAKEQISEVLRRRHRIRKVGSEDFTVNDMSEIAAAAAQTTAVFTLLLGSIAAVSLLVGGIGIMNIMLVSVTERTREIGIRMAIGAKEVDIMYQFLIEAVVLSVSGGIVGIMLGIGLSYLIPLFAKWPASVSYLAIVIAFFFSGAVGVFFGFYPAKKAAALDPIDALRYE